MHGCFRQRLLSTNVCCQQTFTVNKSAALPNGSDQQNLNWTKGRNWQNSTAALYCGCEEYFWAFFNSICSSWLIVSLSKPHVALMMISTLGNMKDFFVVLIFDKLWCWYFSEVSVFFPHYSERNQVWVGEWWFVYLARCFYFFWERPLVVFFQTTCQCCVIEMQRWHSIFVENNHSWWAYC